ncbi:MAG: hypothetical protein AB4352_18925 [Hormoscilla sp.]
MVKKYISSEEYRQRLVRDADRRFAEWHRDFLDYQKKFLAEMSLHPLESEVAAQKTEPSKRVEKKPEKKVETTPRVAKAQSNRKENRPSPQGVESEPSNQKENRQLPQRVESEPSNQKENRQLPQRVESEPSNRKENGQRQENRPKNE